MLEAESGVRVAFKLSRLIKFFATVPLSLGPLRPESAESTGPGRARGPLTLRLPVADDEGRRLRGSSNLNEQPRSYPIYWRVPTDRPRPNLRLGAKREHTGHPKWRV